MGWRERGRQTDKERQREIEMDTQRKGEKESGEREGERGRERDREWREGKKERERESNNYSPKVGLVGGFTRSPVEGPGCCPLLSLSVVPVHRRRAEACWSRLRRRRGCRSREIHATSRGFRQVPAAAEDAREDVARVLPEVPAVLRRGTPELKKMQENQTPVYAPSILTGNTKVLCGNSPSLLCEIPCKPSLTSLQLFPELG